MGMIAGLATDFAEISGLAGDELAPEMENLASAIVASIGKNVTSKTWLRGLAEAVHAMDDPDRYGNRYIQNYARSMVPSAVATVERTMAPELDAVYGMIDSMKSRIPILSDSLPPKRNFWGDVITTGIGKEQGWAEMAYSALSPVYVSEAKHSPIDKELTRLKMGLDMPTRKQIIHGVPMELTPLELNDYILFMNKTPLPEKNLKETLSDLVKNQGYKSLPDERKEIQIRKVVNKARDAGKLKLIEKYPQLSTEAQEFKLRTMGGIK